MPIDNNRQLISGMILLSGLLLLSACSSTKLPSEVVEIDNSPNLAPVTADLPAIEPDESIVYEPESPELYIVQEGDTLWDISAVFLRDPWFWPEIWFKNPQIENPHLIYPGDTLAIIYVGGERRVQLSTRGENGELLSSSANFERNIHGLPVVKVNPRVRATAIDASIPSIPIESIRHLLTRPIIIDQKTMEESAYVLSSLDEHLINSINDKLYVRQLDASVGNGRFQIFRPERPLRDPETQELLGFEALYVGESKLLKTGDPASLRVTNSVREILRNDRLLPIDNSIFERDFFPKPPDTEVSGRIVALLDAITQTGIFQTIAVNLGQREGVQTGDLLSINRTGINVGDDNEPGRRFVIKLPDERVGMAMIIRSFEKMSFALIMEADFPITINDYVRSP